MTHKLIALNVALAVLLAAAGWRLWKEVESANELESAVAGRPLEPAVPPPATPVTPPAPVLASDYIEVARKLLFFPDRNPEVVIDVAPEKPLPPLPVAHGVLDLGSGPTVILSKNAKAPQQAYRVGDTYEEFRIADIRSDAIVFEWEDKRIYRTIAELEPEEGSVPAQQTTRASKPAAPKKPSTAVIGDSAKAGPSDIDMGGDIRACRPGDTSPPGTVSGGYKKVVTQTPFGKVCRWEPSK